MTWFTYHDLWKVISQSVCRRNLTTYQRLLLPKRHKSLAWNDMVKRHAGAHFTSLYFTHILIRCHVCSLDCPSGPHPKRWKKFCWKTVLSWGSLETPWRWRESPCQKPNPVSRESFLYTIHPCEDKEGWFFNSNITILRSLVFNISRGWLRSLHNMSWPAFLILKIDAYFICIFHSRTYFQRFALVSENEFESLMIKCNVLDWMRLAL